MKRIPGTLVLGVAVLAALGGCAYQDPLALPELGPPARSSQQQYPGYNPYYGSGSVYSYNYGYGSGYRPGYDPYYSYYYGGGDPRYYSPGVVYVPYPQYVPVPCADSNHDGRCDKRPPKNHGPDNGPNHDDDGRDDKPDGVTRPPRPRDDRPGEGPRVPRSGEVNRYLAPALTPFVVPAPPRPAQMRPAEPPRRAAPPPPTERGPRVGPGRAPRAGDDRSPSRPTPEP
jgi:hypothetical protein